MCFDKTGTLTEDGLDLGVVLPVRKKDGQAVFGAEAQPADLDHGGDLLSGMAACHSIIKLNSELAGDPMDLGRTETKGVFFTTYKVGQDEHVRRPLSDRGYCKDITSLLQAKNPLKPQSPR